MKYFVLNIEWPLTQNSKSSRKLISILFYGYLCLEIKEQIINCSYAGEGDVVSEEYPILFTWNKINVSAGTKHILM